MTPDKVFASMIASLRDQIKAEILEELKLTETQRDERLTVEEAVEYLRVSKETIYRLCKEKQIPHISLGVHGSKKPRILFSRFSLDSWIRNKEAESLRR